LSHGSDPDPGYRDLYGDIPTTYEKVAATLPSETLLISAAALNDELYALVNDSDVQLTILQRLTARLSATLRVDLAGENPPSTAVSSIILSGWGHRAIYIQRETPFRVAYNSLRAPACLQPAF
jgi:hypothetical protein